MSAHASIGAGNGAAPAFFILFAARAVVCARAGVPLRCAATATGARGCDLVPILEW
jgi:hypothetical protein